ncbi:hypothetical protein Tco_0233813 [Tanacetum coccineum]
MVALLHHERNHPKMSREEMVSIFSFSRARPLMGIFKSRKVVCGEIFCSFFITDNDIKFLEQQNPPEQSWLSILLSKQVPCVSEWSVIHYVLDKTRYGRNFSLMHTLGKTAPTAKSLASHMISKGKSQSGATRIGAWVNFILRVSNASMHSFEKINGVSFSRRWVIGRAILEKS